MENALSILLLIVIVCVCSYLINRREKRQKEQEGNRIFEEGRVHYDRFQKEIHKCRNAVHLEACENQIPTFQDRFYTHPCYEKYMNMIKQSLKVKDLEIQAKYN